MKAKIQNTYTIDKSLFCNVIGWQKLNSEIFPS